MPRSDPTTAGAWVRCFECRGYGIVANGLDAPITCPTCRGSGEERARDEQGRFTNTTRDTP